jgi:hypothetical protein
LQLSARFTTRIRFHFLTRVRRFVFETSAFGRLI